jgi:hypothetical protein
MVLVVLLSVAGVALPIVWAHGRYVRAQQEEHAAAVERTAREPGTLVTDPALEAGVVLIDLVPAAPAFELQQPATIHAGGVQRAWTPGSPVVVDAPPEGRRLPLSVAGPYAAEPASIGAPSGSHGARVTVRVIPIEPPETPPPPSPETPEKRFEVDLTHPDRIAYRWKIAHVVVTEEEAGRAYAGLADRFRSGWQMQRGHFDVADRKLDQAVVRVLPSTSFGEIFPVVEALLSVTRLMYLAGNRREVPAFNVEVRLPQPPRLREAEVLEPLPWRSRLPSVRPGALAVSGRLAPDVVQKVLDGARPRVLACYERGLTRQPKLGGRVTVRFVIGSDGAVGLASNGGSELTDPATTECIVNVFETLSFPRPAGGIVTVIAPYVLAPS